jgi:uncharacterized protein (DUF58 family)
MIAGTWHGLTAHIAARGRAWAHKRQGQDARQVTLHSRRIYILPTRAGIVYGGVTIILLISSMNFSNNMGFALTFLLAGIGLVCMHHCHRNLNGLLINLHDTESGFAGTQVIFHLRLRNPGNEPRWQVAAGWSRRSGQTLSIGPGEAQATALALPAPVRGPLAAPRIAISSSFPLGLFRAWSWLHIDATAIVWPEPATHAERPPASGGDEAQGCVTRQQGDDLSGHRQYREGDPPRRIDWKVLARRGELMVREYRDGNTNSTWLDWDSLPELRTEERLSVLTRLALDAHASAVAWGLRIPGVVVAPATGEAHLQCCLDHLALHGMKKPAVGADHAT